MTGEEKRAEIEQRLADDNPDALFMDGLDAAIVGTARQHGSDSLVVYDRDLIIAELMKDMSEEDALDHYGFNIECAYVGPGTPLILVRAED